MAAWEASHDTCVFFLSNLHTSIHSFIHSFVLLSVCIGACAMLACLAEGSSQELVIFFAASALMASSIRLG